MDDGRLHFPATARNREAIAEVLEPLLPQRGLVLEIASGSGEHLCHFQQQFAASHPLLRWQDDCDPREGVHRNRSLWTKVSSSEVVLRPRWRGLEACLGFDGASEGKQRQCIAFQQDRSGSP